MFKTVMHSQEGEDVPNVGCYLELVEHRKIIWTDALAPGYRPSGKSFFTAILTFEDHAGGTKYTARALHKDDADRKTHADTGFQGGWSRYLDQLVAVMKKERAQV